ncbi:hypothetical protein BABINDRAFT_67152 [Babjeviella inositovora NRRL Y-12698]|uniref:Transcriptional repressor Tup1 N-terminal domain-containing protein n=1 Tax=Babjeviella inositovora NRRL Y-12698 TaxID=984486 RepID=A0A1E3QIE8_9ASCO|nr:uncharacterized protein BABINDRAFT_67152 [Babjeviella inositovora NRRL Y-12698]ODQ77469.1 hypothetical protein BABINDRAFT_67152 [Babjeviella inositovora NRRL Y-12698]
MSYQNRPPSHGRLNELLDAIKQEFDSVNSEASVYRMHKDEFDIKFSQQTAEMNQIRQTVYELESAHRKIKEAYEDEIMRLKTELDARDRQQHQHQQQHQQQIKNAYYSPQTQTQPPLHLLPPPQLPEVKTEVKPEAALVAPAASEFTLPKAQRAQHSKPLPSFLADLEPAKVPAHLKKVLDDYYVLYNPQFTTNNQHKMDVDVVHTLSHSSVVCCVRFSKDGKFLATGCNKTTQVYGVETGSLVAKLIDESSSASTSDAAATPTSDLYIRSVCFSPDGKYLATGAEDKLIRIWDLSTRTIVKYLKGHEQDIYSLDFFPDGQRLVSGSGDKTVRIWDCNTGQCSLTLSIEDGVTTVAVSPDGQHIAAGSLDRAVRVWDAATGFLVERLDSEVELDNGHQDSVYSVAFTNNGSEIVSGSLDKTVKLWSLKGSKSGVNAPEAPASSNSCEVTYVGHKDFVLSVCATPNSEYILSGSKDRGVIFWEKKSGDPLLMLQGHRNSVISVSVANSGDGNSGLFATGSGDCRARIWRWTKSS